MEELKRLDSTNVPVLKAVWVYAGDVVGITVNGEPVVLARLEGNQGMQGAEPKRKRAQRFKREKEETSPVKEPE